MPTVTATPCPLGVHMPLSEFARTYEGPDDPPEDAIIGECIGEAVRAAWKAGHDPTLPSYVVLVTFR